MGKTIYCLSNGSPIDFPDNTLTSFGNKLPFLYDFQNLQNLKFHIALEAIGFSTNFDRNILPNRAVNPSIIITQKETSELKTPSKCLNPKGTNIHSCYREYLDAVSPVFDKIQQQFYRYIFFEPDDLTYNKIIKFFNDLREYIDAITEEDVVNKSIKLIGLTPMILWININFLDYIDIELIPTVSVGDIEHQKHQERKRDKNYIKRHAIHLNGDKYVSFRLDAAFSHVVFNLGHLVKPKLPKIIKVRCDNIRDQIFDDEKSKDLIVFCPEIGSTNNFFFHEFEAKTYCVLENTLLNTVKFQLVDENNEQLNLKVGIPTILKLDIQAMSKYKKSFNVRVTSEKQPNHPNNSRSQFSVTLPQTLFLNDTWKVALSSVNLPNVFNTFVKEHNYLTYLYKDANNTGRKLEYLIPNKNYTKEELLAEINFFLKNNKANILLGEIKEVLNEETQESIACIKMIEKGSFTMTRDIAEVLGYTGVSYRLDKKYFSFSDVNLPYEEFKMDQPINIDYFKPTYFMLYSKLVEPTAVSGVFLNILKIFPVSQTSLTYVIQEFKHREYLALSNFDVKEISFELRSHAGDLIQFNSRNNDTVILNLHFTNY
jgi:hypothetical protein